MKKLLLGAVSAVALLAAGTAFADGSSTTIDQVGTSQSATVDQTAAKDGSADITQGTGGAASTDANNVASVTQAGKNNAAAITQSQGGYGVANPSNTSTSDQEGQSGSVVVIQVGNDVSSVSQTSNSNDEHAIIGQSNNYNSSNVLQSGVRELGVVNQEQGTGNQATIAQSGQGTGVFAPSMDTDPNSNFPGPGELLYGENVPNDSVLPGASSGLTTYGPVGAIVDQIGSNNVGGINQAGADNFADVSQENDSATGGNVDYITQGGGQSLSEAVTYQYGQFNTIGLNQDGEGNSLSLAFQSGNYNQADATQTGRNDSSTIDQGWAIGDSEPLLVPTVTDYSDVASVNQSGAGDSSFINQEATSDSATVSQIGATDVSTIHQAGSSNTSTIGQSGASDTSDVLQGGSTEVAWVSQTGNSNQSTIDQSLAISNDNAYVTQSTAGNGSLVTQQGSYNTATVRQ